MGNVDSLLRLVPQPIISVNHIVIPACLTEPNPDLSWPLSCLTAFDIVGTASRGSGGSYFNRDLALLKPVCSNLLFSFTLFFRTWTPSKGNLSPSAKMSTSSISLGPCRANGALDSLLWGLWYLFGVNSSITSTLPCLSNFGLIQILDSAIVAFSSNDANRLSSGIIITRLL